jgi:hypothetical protein
MNRGCGRSGGYTIVEVMIFLAITGAMFVSAMVFIGGQQRKTEFTQGVRTFASDITNIANDVSTGFTSFPFQTGQYCWIDAASRNVSVGAGGSNHCIFIGRAIQFAPNNATDTYKLYSVVGKQYSAPSVEVQDLASATPLLLAKGTSYNASDPTNSEITKHLTGGLTIAWVHYGTTPVRNTNAIGFYSTFASYAGSTISSTSTRVNLIPLPISQTTCLAKGVTNANRCLGDTETVAVDHLDGYLQGLNKSATDAITNNTTGNTVMICLDSGGTNQHAEVTLGGSDNGTLQVSTFIKDQKCAAP